MDACMHRRTDSSFQSIGVPRGSVVKVHDGRGMRMCVVNGMVWVTQSGSAGDVFLDAGECLRIEHDGLTLVSTCGRAPFALVTLESHTPPATFGGRLLEIWRGVRAMLLRSRLAGG
jgi:hypothetical protein